MIRETKQKDNNKTLKRHAVRRNWLNVNPPMVTLTMIHGTRAGRGGTHRHRDLLLIFFSSISNVKVGGSRSRSAQINK